MGDPIADLRRLQTDLDRRVPERQSEEVTVTFLAADTDQDVPYTILTPEDPETIRYEPVRKDRAADIYDDQSSANRRRWTSTYIVLRSTVAGAIITLRLTTR